MNDDKYLLLGKVRWDKESKTMVIEVVSQSNELKSIIGSYHKSGTVGNKIYKAIEWKPIEIEE